MKLDQVGDDGEDGEESVGQVLTFIRIMRMNADKYFDELHVHDIILIKFLILIIFRIFFIPIIFKIISILIILKIIL